MPTLFLFFSLYSLLLSAFQMDLFLEVMRWPDWGSLTQKLYFHFPVWLGYFLMKLVSAFWSLQLFSFVVLPLGSTLNIVSARFSEFEQILKDQPLQLPPKPPHKRVWRGSTVAPFAGNNMLVLYSCSANSTSKYFVQVLHNEHPIPLAVSLC